MNPIVEAMTKAILDHAEAGKYGRLLAASLTEGHAMVKLRKARYQAQVAYDAIGASGHSVVRTPAIQRGTRQK
jgi:hypothetical protein